MQPIRKAAVGAVLVGATLTGGAIGGALINGSANAQTSTTTPAAPGAPGGGSFDPTQGGHVGANGQKEVLLTGDTADRVRAAAQAAVSGGTIQRVETDAEGSPYEAHMTKSDGTPVTVKVDSNYKVTGVENGPGNGFGPGPASQQ